MPDPLKPVDTSWWPAARAQNSRSGMPMPSAQPVPREELERPRMPASHAQATPAPAPERQG
jgi:hypothetical protein